MTEAEVFSKHIRGLRLRSLLLSVATIPFQLVLAVGLTVVLSIGLCDVSVTVGESEISAETLSFVGMAGLAMTLVGGFGLLYFECPYTRLQRRLMEAQADEVRRRMKQASKELDLARDRLSMQDPEYERLVEEKAVALKALLDGDAREIRPKFVGACFRVRRWEICMNSVPPLALLLEAEDFASYRRHRDMLWSESQEVQSPRESEFNTRPRDPA